MLRLRPTTKTGGFNMVGGLNMAGDRWRAAGGEAGKADM